MSATMYVAIGADGDELKQHKASAADNVPRLVSEIVDVYFGFTDEYPLAILYTFEFSDIDAATEGDLRGHIDELAATGSVAELTRWLTEDRAARRVMSSSNPQAVPTTGNTIPSTTPHKDSHGNQNNCWFCGQHVRPSAQWELELVDGGGQFARIGTADENDAGYMGMHVVGPDCAKRLPDGFTRRAPK